MWTWRKPIMKELRFCNTFFFLVVHRCGNIIFRSTGCAYLWLRPYTKTSIKSDDTYHKWIINSFSHIYTNPVHVSLIHFFFDFHLLLIHSRKPNGYQIIIFCGGKINRFFLCHRRRILKIFSDTSRIQYENRDIKENSSSQNKKMLKIQFSFLCSSSLLPRPSARYHLQ